MTQERDNTDEDLSKDKPDISGDDQKDVDQLIDAAAEITDNMRGFLEDIKKLPIPKRNLTPYRNRGGGVLGQPPPRKHSTEN